MGLGLNLFKFLVDCIIIFLEEIDPLGSTWKDASKPPLKLGFTFSFPVNQTAIDKGTTPPPFSSYSLNLFYWIHLNIGKYT
jgi:hypothetical protein